MAQSRLERIGTIYSRITSLLKGGGMRPEDKPLWLDIYKAFPPKSEPRFDRAAPNISIRDIFYKEDIIRAKFQKYHSKYSTDLLMDKTPSSTQKFLAIYKELEKNGGVEESQLYEVALEKWAEQFGDTAKLRGMKKEGAATAGPRRVRSSGSRREESPIHITDLFNK